MPISDIVSKSLYHHFIFVPEIEPTTTNQIIMYLTDVAFPKILSHVKHAVLTSPRANGLLAYLVFPAPFGEKMGKDELSLILTPDSPIMLTCAMA